MPGVLILNASQRYFYNWAFYSGLLKMILADIATSQIVTDLLPKYVNRLHKRNITTWSRLFNISMVSTIVSLLDIDECEEGTHNCSSEVNCSNSLGSFSCRTEEEEDSFVGKCNLFYKFMLYRHHLSLTIAIKELL